MLHPRFGISGLYLAIFFLALTGLYAKLIPLDAISVIQLRGIVAAIGLGLFLFLRKRSLRLESTRIFIGVYTLGLLLGVHWVTFFHAMQVSTVAVGMLSMFSFPMITILIEPMFTGQGWKVGDILAGAITLLGLTLMLTQGQTATSGSITSGVAWGVLSAVLFALRNLFQKYRFKQVASDSLMFHQVISVGIILALFADYPRIITLSGLDFFKIVLLGIFSTAGAHTLLVFSLKQLSAKSVALISCLQPVIAMFLAWYVINEVPGPAVIVGGGAVIFVAAYESIRKREVGPQ